MSAIRTWLRKQTTKRTWFCSQCGYQHVGPLCTRCITRTDLPQRKAGDERDGASDLDYPIDEV